jgi:hypothetical protein
MVAVLRAQKRIGVVIHSVAWREKTKALRFRSAFDASVSGELRESRFAPIKLPLIVAIAAELFGGFKRHIEDIIDRCGVCLFLLLHLSSSPVQFGDQRGNLPFQLKVI